MNKLGFAIKLASNGVLMPVVCNKDQWTNKVVDIRDFLKLFNGLAYIEQGHQVSTGNSSTFISFDEEGCFLVLFKALSGRFGDFLSGWIYIPNTIEATGEDIMNTYNYVRNILSQSNINDSIEDINDFFSKEYPKQELAAQYLPSSGEEFGVRFLDVYYSMKEILDTDRYQPYYSKFKAIFLLDKNSEVKISKEQVARFKDLTKIPIEKTCIFKAPSPEEVRLLGRGTKIVFSTKQEFNTPVLTKKGERIQLYALRDGFEPIALPIVTIQDDEQKYFIDPKVVEWKKRVSPYMFNVYNRKKEKIEDGLQILINGKSITDQGTLISEEDCRQATVKISAPDYEPFEQNLNLLQGEYEVTLSREVKSYQATIELANGGFAKMNLESKDLFSEEKSPLRGYAIEEVYSGKQVLRMSFWFVWKQRLWGFCAALVAVMLIIAYTAFDTWTETHHFKLGLPPWEKIETDNSSQPSEPIEPKELNSQTEPTIVGYLNSNAQWSKVQLEKDSLTQGLYDKINEYRFTELVDININGCDIITKIKTLAQEMNARNITISGKYSRDGTITVQNWIDNVRSKIDDSNGSNLVENNQSQAAQKAAAKAAQKTAEDVEEINLGL